MDIVKISLATLLLLSIILKAQCDLVRIWKRLGWKNVVVLGSPNKSLSDFAPLLKVASSQFISVGIKTQDEYFSKPQPNVEQVVFWDNVEAIKALKERGHPVYKSLMVQHSANEEALKTYLKSLPMDTGFFYLALNDRSSQLFRVQSFRSQFEPVMNPWIPMAAIDLFEENFTFQGQLFNALDLDYAPQFAFKDCHATDELCDGEGIVWDIMEYIARIQNFTLRSTRNHNGEWDTHFDTRNGTFQGQGVMARVYRGEYDGSLASWRLDPFRAEHFDMTWSPKPQKLILVCGALPRSEDFSLLLRPFSKEVLSIICGVGVVLTLGAWVRFRFLLKLEGSWSIQIFVFSAGLLSFLLSAHYGGAITMFLTSQKQSVPFTTVEDGLKLYPEWKLVVTEGEQYYIYHQLDLFARVLKSYQADGELALYANDVRSIVLKLKEGKFFTYGGSTHFINQYMEMKQQGLDVVDLQFLGHSPYITSSLLPKNSPWTKVLNLGTLKAWQSGTIEQIYKIWNQEVKMDKEGTNEQIQVSLNHCLSAIFGYATALAIVLVVLLVEVLTKCPRH